MKHTIPARAERVMRAGAPLLDFLERSAWARRRFEPGISDLVFGNPQEMPVEGFAEALRRHTDPKSKDWFAYKTNEPESRAVVVEALRERRGVAFEEEDIFLTNGAFGGIAVALGVITDAGDEVILNTPPWFFYEALIESAGASAVRVPLEPERFDLDLPTIEAAITRRTRAIIVNSPQNPTGRVYPPELLAGLGEILTRASVRYGRPIYLVSDEAYCRIVFDGRRYPSPTEHYPYSFLVYTYAKTLLTPGQRLGYLALPPAMPDRESLRPAVVAAQFVAGFAFPNAVMQYALRDLERLSIDVEALQRRRDRLVSALRGQGYEAWLPEGTFYVVLRSPIEDDVAFSEVLAEEDVFVLPGRIAELPGFFRVSLTASDEMIERALPGFERALRHAKKAAPR